jgi:hypothetical protein
MYTSDFLEIVYELPLLPNNTTKQFYTNREQCKVLIGYLSLGRWPISDWDEYDIEQNVLQCSFQTGSSGSPSYFQLSPLSHSSRRPLLEV